MTDQRNDSRDEIFLQQLEIVRDILKKEEKPSGGWDRAAKIATTLTPVVLAVIGGVATVVYQTNQNRISEMQAVERFIPYLAGADENQKRTAILVISTLAREDIALRIAALNPSQGTVDAADRIMRQSQAADASPATSQQKQNPAQRSESSRWVYLGQFDRNVGRWRTRYFDFGDGVDPQAISGRRPRLRVRIATGALNVRSGMPDPAGLIPDVVDVLAPGETARIRTVYEWRNTGFMWAPID